MVVGVICCGGEVGRREEELKEPDWYKVFTGKSVEPEDISRISSSSESASVKPDNNEFDISFAV